MNFPLWIILGWLCWSLIVARVAWKSGHAAGVRHRESDAERAYRRGIVSGRREERAEVGR